MLRRPCLDCGVAFTPRFASVHRCLSCQRRMNIQRNAQPERAIYKGAWPAESRAIREAEPWCHSKDVGLGPCSVVGVKSLTVDHPTRKALCRHHHGKLEAQRRRFVAVRERGEAVRL